MKKVLALILALACVFSLVACGGSNETVIEEPAELTAAQKAQQVADGFMDAFVALDVEAMKTFVDDPEASIIAAFKDFDKAAMLESVPEEYAAFEEEFANLLDVLIGQVSSNMSYVIKDSSEADGKFEFNYEINVPDFSNVDITTLLSESMDEEALGSIIVDLVTNGGLDTSSTQEDIMAAAMPKVFELVEGVIKEMTFETNTETAKIVVAEIDGNWVIDTAASGM